MVFFYQPVLFNFLKLISIVGENHKKSRQIKEAIVNFGYNSKFIFDLMLNTAQFEFVLKEVND